MPPFLPPHLRRTRKRPHNGRDFPEHRRWIRRHSCIVSGCFSTSIECAHYRTAANSGTGQKPADWWCFPCCTFHHSEQHAIGQNAFESKYGVSLAELTAEFARRSPDGQMRQAKETRDERD